jgi:hypothetical protein
MAAHQQRSSISHVPKDGTPDRRLRFRNPTRCLYRTKRQAAVKVTRAPEPKEFHGG